MTALVLKCAKGQGSSSGGISEIRVCEESLGWEKNLEQNQEYSDLGDQHLLGCRLCPCQVTCVHSGIPDLAGTVCRLACSWVFPVRLLKAQDSSAYMLTYKAKTRKSCRSSEVFIQ